MTKAKPVKLNKLQNRTLALMQVLANRQGGAVIDSETGDATITQLPRPHGDHVHVGDFVVSGRDASGFANQAVWVALERKGLAKSNFPLSITLTKAGLTYDTGYGEVLKKSDH
jgi:hypothetical protein